MSFPFWPALLCIIGYRFIQLIRIDSNTLIFVSEWYSIVYLYHNFLIHSTADRHLGCFHVIAFVNSTAMNIEVHVFLLIQVSSGYMPSSVIAGSYGSSIPSFLKETFTLFSIVAAPICIPTNSVRWFPFLHTLSSIYCL